VETERATKKKKATKKRATKKKVTKKRSTKKKATKKHATKNKATKKRSPRKRAAKKTPVPKLRAEKFVAAAPKPAPEQAPEPAPEPVPEAAPEPERMAPSMTVTPQPSAPGDDAERRVCERHDVPELLEVEIEMFGYQRTGRPGGMARAPDATQKIHAFGTTVNLSLTGMLAEILDPIAKGSHCLVHVVNAGTGLRPELRWGLVLRCHELETGRFEVAVSFDSPLDRLDTDSLVAA